MTLEPAPPLDVIAPSDWSDLGVGAFMTTRAGGVSCGPYGDVAGRAGLNLGFHVDDLPAAVRQNQEILARHLPSAPRWLNQVHGNVVYQAGDVMSESMPTADAAVTARPGLVLAILSADCLPVLLADPVARVVGAAHGGWRGLAQGVLARTVRAMADQGGEPERIHAWLGASIGPRCFEVGKEVPDAFVRTDVRLARCFVPHPANPTKWLGDLHQIAHIQLAQAGVRVIAANPACTFEDHRFFSFRRDGVCGRMASLVWLV